MTDPLVAILIPVLNRPHAVAPLIRSINENTPEPHRIVFICSPGDTAELGAIKRCMTGHPVTAFTINEIPTDGDYARKINAGYHNTVEPLLFLGADDIRFHPNWLPNAVALLDDTTHVIGTNDLGNPRTIEGTHSTHTLVTRTYIDEHGTIDRPGEVLHEGYPHEFVDDEFIATAQYRGMYAHAHDSIVEHLHPRWGKREKDHLASRGKHRVARGRSHYNVRRLLWEQP